MFMGCKGSKQAAAVVAPTPAPPPPAIKPAPPPANKEVKVEAVQRFSEESDGDEKQPSKPAPLPKAPSSAATAAKMNSMQARPVEAAVERAMNKSEFEEEDVAEVDNFIKLNTEASNAGGFLQVGVTSTSGVASQGGTASKRYANGGTGNASSRQAMYLEDPAEEPAPPSVPHEPPQPQQSQRYQAQESQRYQPPPEQAAVDPNDPWASLQSQYKIKEAHQGGAGAQRSPSMAASGPGGGLNGKASAGGPPAKEMLVLGDDDDDFLNNTRRGNQQQSTTLGGPRRNPGSITGPAGQPKQGGWGQGELAAAGTLMVGDDDYLLKDPSFYEPPAGPQQAQAGGRGGGGGYGQHDEDDGVFGGGPPRQAMQNDVVFEDLDEVDAVLEDELGKQGLGNNPDLAAKLRQFEQQFDDDD